MYSSSSNQASNSSRMGEDFNYSRQIKDNIGKAGNRIGFKSERLQVDPNDPACSVAFVRLKRSGGVFGRLKEGAKAWALKKAGKKYIKIEIDSIEGGMTHNTKEVAVNVKSVCSKLGLSKEDVRALGEKGELGSVLTRVKKGAEAEDDVRKYVSVDEDKDLSFVQNLASTLANHVLKKAPIKDQKGQTVSFSAEFIDIKGNKPLGEGSFGTVYKVERFSLQTFEVIAAAEKESNTHRNNQFIGKKNAKQAVDDMQHENDNLEKISLIARLSGQSDVLKGIQKKPFELTVNQLTVNGVKVQKGYMRGKLYLGDLKKVNDYQLTKEEKINGMTLLVKGLAFIQEQGLVHVDIKPANIFVDKDKKGKRFFRLADFGGARWEEDLKDGDPLTFTPNYVLGNELFPFPRYSTEDKDASHQLSTFQMGVSLFYMLSGGQLPYHPIRSGKIPCLDPSSTFNRKALEKYPDELVDFIEKMCAKNPEDRPIGKQLVEEWEKALEDCGGLEELMLWAN